eukprot:TRINITY_DN31166_c0_g1_i1.p1 TRINITY_DN31166_c0_g1~~TRINITY_DN31166_c0_g1_i1.p1  ORF type:complete len:497 (-),score=151.62 TRINITY_DN31166_c0_g1_i1:72-1562(-)
MKCIFQLAATVFVSMLFAAGGGRVRKGNTQCYQAAKESVGPAFRERFLYVKESLEDNFHAMPKNQLGQVPPKEFLPHIVRSYFAREHGWLLRGLEPPSLRKAVVDVDSALILLERAPKLVEALQSKRNNEMGLSVLEVASVVAAIEALVLEENIPVLRSSFALNGYLPEERIDLETLDAVLTSYLLLFWQGNSRNLTDVDEHAKLKASAVQNPDSWGNILAFEHEARDHLHDEGFQHGAERAADGKYSFDDATRAMKVITEKFGKFQNSECVDMKKALMDLDPTGTGRVPLDVFKAQPNYSKFQFTEEADYLRSVGALDETGSTPSVLIANYITGPSNCIASSKYYAVCCLSECDALVRELEGKATSQEVMPKEMLKLLDGLSPTFKDLLKTPQEQLQRDLENLATQHGGKVPLYSAGFAGLLHKEFPNECPRPTLADVEADNAEEAAGKKWADAVAPTSCSRLPKWQQKEAGEAKEQWSLNRWFHAPSSSAASEL